MIARNTIPWVVLLAAAWLLGDSYVVYLYGVGLVYAVATLGLHLLVNDCGDISLAQGGQVALGAFAGAHLFPLAPGPLGPLLLVLGAIFAGGVTGAIVSIPMLKLRGLAVAVITLLLNAAIFGFVLRLPDFAGGSGGLFIHSEWLPVDDLQAVGWLTVITALAAVAVGLIRRGRFGLGLRAIRANEPLARSAGIPVERYRMACYTLTGTIAGLGGAMWVILHHGIAPSAFTGQSSLLLLTLALLGGRGGAAGPMSAAVAMGLVTGLLGEYGVVVSFLAPAALILVLIRHPGGLNEQIDLVATLVRRLMQRSAAPPVEQPEGEDEGPAEPTDDLPDVPVKPAGPAVLRCSDVAVTFGGLQALRGESIEVGAGEVLALVGPNGAGKTTLLNTLSGHVRPMRGRVWLGEADVTRAPAHRRAMYGLRRTFQVGGHMDAESGLDHLRLGGHVDRKADTRLVARELGLSNGDLQGPVADLPAGTARLIEIGIALAIPGKVLLLDEPTVGLTPVERGRLVAILRELPVAVVLVDHDIAFIRRIAHRVIALSAGEVIATGTPDQVFADPAFIAAYLGSSEVMV